MVARFFFENTARVPRLHQVALPCSLRSCRLLLPQSRQQRWLQLVTPARQSSMAPSDKGTGFSLKDQLFNRERVGYLARLFGDADSRFDDVAFVRETMRGFKKLELKERIVHIAAQLEKHLDEDFRIAAKQIRDALPPPLDPTRTDDDFGDFIFAPLGEFVVRNGLTKAHLRLSLRTLKEVTQRFSMEDAIRGFINEYPTQTMSQLEKWAAHKNYHVRRLVSEGSRPMLPWSKRLVIPRTLPLPLLDRLHADPTRYVTRSVANHLNDIAKVEPDTVLNTLQRWRKQGKQDKVELAWMNKHALRTLVKKGNQKALRFLGFRPNPKVRVSEFALRSAQLKPGDAVEMSFRIEADRAEALMVDYVIEFVKANGSLSPKVHKLKQIELEKGQSVLLQKRHILRANATTYTLYPGRHFIALQINGRAFGKCEFQLS